ncbi:MAG: hypothetical protein C1O27_001477 [Chloroflexi bacterium]|jgi:hypothetical protein|nr:MAG: hypothetical protein C1O27_001477 [Chloroflexota bacterium]
METVGIVLTTIGIFGVPMGFGWLLIRGRRGENTRPPVYTLLSMVAVFFIGVAILGVVDRA